MPASAIASYTDQASYVLGHFATQISLDAIVRLYHVDDTRQFLVRQIVRFLAGTDLRFRDDFTRRCGTNSVEIPQRVLDALLPGYINT